MYGWLLTLWESQKPTSRYLVQTHGFPQLHKAQELLSATWSKEAAGADANTRQAAGSSSTQVHPRAEHLQEQRQKLAFSRGRPMNGDLFKGKALSASSWKSDPDLEWMSPWEIAYSCTGPVNLLSNMNGVKHKDHVTSQVCSLLHR